MTTKHSTPVKIKAFIDEQCSLFLLHCQNQEQQHQLPAIVSNHHFMFFATQAWLKLRQKRIRLFSISHLVQEIDKLSLFEKTEITPGSYNNQYLGSVLYYSLRSKNLSNDDLLELLFSLEDTSSTARVSITLQQLSVLLQENILPQRIDFLQKYSLLNTSSSTGSYEQEFARIYCLTAPKNDPSTCALALPSIKKILKTHIMLLISEKYYPKHLNSSSSSRFLYDSIFPIYASKDVPEKLHWMRSLVSVHNLLSINSDIDPKTSNELKLKYRSSLEVAFALGITQCFFEAITPAHPSLNVLNIPTTPQSSDLINKNIFSTLNWSQFSCEEIQEIENNLKDQLTNHNLRHRSILSLEQVSFCTTCLSIYIPKLKLEKSLANTTDIESPTFKI